MRIKKFVLVAALIASVFYAPSAQAGEKPLIELLTFTPSEIDLLSTSSRVDIELTVSHPSGIENFSTVATLINADNNTLNTTLFRVDSPMSLSLTKVVFKGNLVIPRSISTGVYNFSFSPIKNNSIAGYQYSADNIEPRKIRNLSGGEYGLVVRSSGNLNLVYDTFVGPTYVKSLGVAYNDPVQFNSTNIPIWKVGETFNPNKYYELRVPALSLQVTSSTPTTCTSDGKFLKFISEGLCTFKVFTPKTVDYASKISEESVTVTAARIKPELSIQKIANQTATNLPKLIDVSRVYSASEGFVLPQSETPTVCFASGFSINLVSGGTCSLTYQTKETATYSASDIYKVTFEITRESQSISFSPPLSVNISSKTLNLNASASGGGLISYLTNSTDICSITGTTLNLLKSGNCVITASQSGTSTLAPVSASATITLTGTVVTPKPVLTKKTIVCVKGNTTKKVSGTNPKCPKGYKLKK